MRSVNAIFRHDCPLAVEHANTPRPLVQKKNWRDSLPIDMLLSAVSVLVVAQSISEIPEGLMNNPVYNKVKDLRIAGTCLHFMYTGQVHFGCTYISFIYECSPCKRQ